jgi:S1-C subfamily serine protease
VVAAVTPGGPAARAGIAPGDVITSIDGQPILSSVDVAEALARLTSGQTVQIAIKKRDGASAIVKVTLGQYPGRS